MFSHSVGGFAVGFAVRYLLSPTGPRFPNNYFLLFLFAAIFYTGSTIGCALIREPVRPVLERPDRLRDVVAAVGPMLRRHRAFRSLVLVGLLGFGLAFSLPFYIVYATTQLGVPEYMAGVYIWASTLGAAVFAIVWGRLNDRRGPRAVLRGGCTFVLVTPLAALAVPALCRLLAPVWPGALQALPYLYAIVFLSGRSALIALFMGTINYVFEIASDQERPRYIAAFNALSAPGALLPLLMGWVLNFASYTVVFLAVAVAAAGTSLVSWRMPDPRTPTAAP
jgi:MFS family permease